MKVPGAERAVIERSKAREYLLSRAHPVGRFKAAFFSGLGYSEGSWEDLIADLQRHVSENDALSADANAFGQKYEVRGSLRGPTGREALVVSIWIVPHGEAVPRLVTAYPAPKS